MDGMVDRNHSHKADRTAVRPRGVCVYITSGNGITDWSLNAMSLFTFGLGGRGLLIVDEERSFREMTAKSGRPEGDCREPAGQTRRVG